MLVADAKKSPARTKEPTGGSWNLLGSGGFHYPRREQTPAVATDGGLFFLRCQVIKKSGI
jgi:hypothetical protein